MEALGGFGFVVLVFLVILAILWVIMPFYVIGTDGYVKDMNKKMDRIIELLEAQDKEST